MAFDKLTPKGNTKYKEGSSGDMRKRKKRKYFVYSPSSASGTATGTNVCPDNVLEEILISLLDSTREHSISRSEDVHDSDFGKPLISHKTKKRLDKKMQTAEKERAENKIIVEELQMKNDLQRPPNLPQDPNIKPPPQPGNLVPNSHQNISRKYIIF